MRWTPGRRSGNIEDRRGRSMGGRGVAVGGMGIGGLLLVLVFSFLTGRNPLELLSSGNVPDGAPVQTGPIETTPEEEKLVDFVDFVNEDTQATWAKILGGRYQRAGLVLFRDLDESACGMAQSATGPFYCPADQKVYIDLGFYRDLQQRFGAPGDFAQAYVIAHELGHHVQTLLGISAQVQEEQQANPREANRLSVAMELQADCFAGVWGHSTAQRDILERGDVEEGLNAASSIGDDRLQSMAGGQVAPDSFTHGSSEQRVTWFRRGLETGSVDACNTFKELL